MTEKTLIVEKSGGVVTLTLNRPDRLNAFNEEMHGALRSAIDGATKDDACRAVLLTGAGRGFCAGQDLSDRQMGADDAPPDLGHTLDTLYNPLIRAIRAMPKPVICAVNGVAAGAGANIALTCDIVIAARSAKFIQAFSKIGLVPDSGGTYYLPRLVGEARAKGLALLAEPLPAEKAAEWGLIWSVVDDEALMPEATELSRTLAEGPTAGLAFVKQALHASDANCLDQQLDLERDLQQKAGRSPDYREGVAAFFEKRAPKFTGKL